jgi:hypothetical protein
MSSPELELLLTAIAAMLSPTTMTFSVLALVLGDRPRRTGGWFYLGAFTATMVVGVLAAFVLEDAAASPGQSQPKAWVAVLDIVLGVLALLYALRLARRPMDAEKEQQMVGQISKVTASPWIAIVGAGAALANPGGFIPIALKDVSQLDVSSGEYLLYWLAFTLIALLPLGAALVAFTFARVGTLSVLETARAWLTRNAFRIGAVLVAVLGVVLIRNGIVGLTG